MNHIHEPLTNYVIIIEFNGGGTMEVRALGVSEWHAKDKAHSKYMHVQPDLRKYSVKKPLITVL